MVSYISLTIFILIYRWFSDHSGLQVQIWYSLHLFSWILVHHCQGRNCLWIWSGNHVIVLSTINKFLLNINLFVWILYILSIHYSYSFKVSEAISLLLNAILFVKYSLWPRLISSHPRVRHYWRAYLLSSIGCYFINKLFFWTALRQW